MKVKKENYTNPYVDGRKAYAERYGSYIKREYVANIIAVISLIISALAVLGVIYIGSQNKLIPYIVQVDKAGNVMYAGKAQQIYKVDNNVLKSNLADFVTSYKTVYKDAEIQKKYIHKTYSYLSNTFPAFNAVNQYYKNDNVFSRSQKETVNVKIDSVIPISKDTWQIDWLEEIRNERGIIISNDKYKGLATIAIIPPKEEKEIYKNPLGLYIKDFSYSKTLQ